MNQLQKINNRIECEYCCVTTEELSDDNLIEIYTSSKSTQNNVMILENILEKYVNDDIIDKIIQDYFIHLISPGTKGIIRGNHFNKIVKNYIYNLRLNHSNFEIQFEVRCPNIYTDEIPDWFIINRHTNKTLIGMNQVDLWSGGHQLNRGSKYLRNCKYNTSNSKLICVICNKIQFQSTQSKVFKLFKIGFENNTLCYLKNLGNIIKSYLE